MCLIGLVDPGLYSRINVHAHRSFVDGIDRHELQTQFPPSRIELRNASQLRLPSLHSVLIKAGARNPIPTIATTINGHSTTTQKEIFQSEFLGVGFLFMPLSQAFKDRHFREREIFSAILGRGGRTVPRRAAFFPYLATIFRRSGSDSTSCDHGLPFITTQ
jgi:hypothetical protein